MSHFVDAERLEKFFKAEQAALEELHAARNAGIEWMRANGFSLPPQVLQDRLTAAHQKWRDIWLDNQ